MFQTSELIVIDRSSWSIGRSVQPVSQIGRFGRWTLALLASTEDRENPGRGVRPYAPTGL